MNKLKLFMLHEIQKMLLYRIIICHVYIEPPDMLMILSNFGIILRMIWVRFHSIVPQYPAILMEITLLVAWSPYWEHIKEGYAHRHEPNVLFMYYEDMNKVSSSSIDNNFNPKDLII